MTTVTMDLFSSDVPEFPFATKVIKEAPAIPSEGEVISLTSADQGWVWTPRATVKSVLRSEEGEHVEVRLESESTDEELFRVTVLENWGRHRKVKPRD